MSCLGGSHSLGPVLDEQPFDQVLDDSLDLPGPVDFARQDLLVDPEWVVVEERRVAGQHLEDEDP